MLSFFFVLDATQYDAQVNMILASIGKPKLSGIAATNAIDRAGVLLRYGCGVITSSHNVHRRHVHYIIVLNYRMRSTNIPNCIYTSSSIHELFPLMFKCPWTHASPADLQTLSMMKIEPRVLRELPRLLKTDWFA